jgi:DNA polymerase-4
MTIKTWSRVIALADMNAFFASVEQVDNPDLMGKPIGITNSLTGTCIITSSYEARAFGVCTGMRVKEAKRLCPGFIQIAANPVLYAKVSTRIMDSLQDISPDIEIFSVDEAFIDLTRCKKVWDTTPEVIGMMIKQKVFSVSKVKCSVGISGDKSTAKWAAKSMKPDGLTIIPPWEAATKLRDVAVTELCGVNIGIGAFLAKHGAFTCGDVARLPISILGQRFGNPGKRIWYMCQGKDPDKVQTNIKLPKSVGHGKVMPPNTTAKDTIYMYLIHMTEKVTQRLRKNSLTAQCFYIGLKTKHGWLGRKFKIAFPSNSSKPIIELCKIVIYRYWHGEGIYQVQLTALDPREEKGQIDLFEYDDTKDHQLNKALDNINKRYGEFTLAPANLLNRSVMPNVIAPAWRPHGHRQTIQDVNLEKRESGK